MKRRPRDRSGSPGSRPSPRQVGGLAAPVLVRVFLWPYRMIVSGLVRAGVTANQVTLASLCGTLAAAGWIAAGGRVGPGVLLIPSLALDAIDGGVARARGESSPKGAWLDSVADRVADAALFGALFLSLSSQGQERLAALALAALGISLMVSHVRAVAAARGVEVGEGLFARLERAVAILVGLVFTPLLGWALLVIVVLGALTLLQRVALATARLRRAHGRE